MAKKIEYMISTPAIIDVLAIFPSFRQAPLLRAFLIFRLFKLFRYSASARLFSGILVSKRFELYSLLLFACLLVFIASVSVYLFEYSEPNSQINNLFDSFYWAIVTLATVGYGDITAHTTGGRLVTIMLILTSIGVLSFFTSILIAAMNEKLPLMQEKRIASELERYGSFTIICGYGRVGQEIARLLNQDKQKLIIIDKNPEHIVLAQKQGFLTLQQDATKNQVLLSAGILEGASTILCITGDDVTNVYVTLSSRQLNQSIRIISRANRHDNVSKLYQAGADYVIRPFEIAGMLAAEFLGQPVAFEAISGILQNQTDIVMETIWVTEHSLLDDLAIADLELEQYKLTLLGVISDNPIHLKHKNKYQVKQQHFYFNPESKFILRRNDILLVFGRKYGVDHFRDQVEQNRLFNWKKI
jgi:voltage-gated potassium channel